MGDLWTQSAHEHIHGQSQLPSERQSAMAHTVHREQKGTTIKREMQSTVLEMSCTLTAQNASWALCRIPWIILFLSSVFFWFCLSLIFFYPRALEGDSGSGAHTHTAVSTSPPPFLSFIYPSLTSHFPNVHPPALPPPSACLHSPPSPLTPISSRRVFTVREHCCPGFPLGSDHITINLLWSLSFLVGWLHPRAFLPPALYPCFSLLGTCTLTQAASHICKIQKSTSCDQQ